MRDKSQLRSLYTWLQTRIDVIHALQHDVQMLCPPNFAFRALPAALHGELVRPRKSFYGKFGAFDPADALCSLPAVSRSYNYRITYAGVRAPLRAFIARAHSCSAIRTTECPWKHAWGRFTDAAAFHRALGSPRHELNGGFRVSAGTISEGV